MSPLRDLHDRDLDRLLAGRSVVHGEAEDLAEFVRDVRHEHLRPMADDVEARHVSAMAQAARDLSSTEQPAVPAGAPARPRRAPMSLLPKNRLASAAAAIAAVTVTAGLSTVGLAVAGVELPDAASDVFRQVGVTLPNQDEPSDALLRSREERSAAVRAVIAATPPSERQGCAFGQRVAEAARGQDLPARAKEACAAQEARRAEREQERDTPPAGTDVDAAPREDGDGSGAEQSDRARRQRTATPEERPTPGQETGRARQPDRGDNSRGNRGGNGRGNSGDSRRGNRGGNGRGNSGGSPPDPRPGPGGGEAPSSQGRPDDAGPGSGERRGPPEGAGRPEGVGAPEGAGPSPGEGRGRPGGAGRP